MVVLTTSDTEIDLCFLSIDMETDDGFLDVAVERVHADERLKRPGIDP